MSAASDAPADHGDITPLRLAERQRDEALRFLSHDARESGATIQTLLDLARQRPEAFADGSLLPSIEREAQAGLERSDRFVAQARAQAASMTSRSSATRSSGSIR